MEIVLKNPYQKLALYIRENGGQEEIFEVILTEKEYLDAVEASIAKHEGENLTINKVKDYEEPLKFEAYAKMTHVSGVPVRVEGCKDVPCVDVTHADYTRIMGHD